MALMSKRTWPQWLDEYAKSHRHPVNRLCHTIGIPLVVVSLALVPIVFLFGISGLWSAGLFGAGWFFQFLGHAFERKRPEFMNDARFLFVGLRWWILKIRGRA